MINNSFTPELCYSKKGIGELKRNGRDFYWKVAFCLLVLCLSPVALNIPALARDILWNNVGPGGGGYITGIECDPRNPNIVYAGTDLGGFYVSHDTGQTWKIRNKGFNDYYVQCIAIHPDNPGIIIVGTRGGIFKSANQGKIWKWKRKGFPSPSSSIYSAPISSLAYDPSKPSVVYAGVGCLRGQSDGKGAIYKSVDGGESWRLCTPPGILHPEAIVGDIKVAINGSYVLAATTKGIYRSTDEGVSWHKANNGLPHLCCLKLDISPSDPWVSYVTVQTTAQGKEPWNGGVYKSTDRGITWSSCSGSLPKIVRKTSNDALELSTQYREVIVHPKNSDIAYVGAICWPNHGIYKTSDGGKTWERILYKNAPNVDYGWLSSFSTSVTALAISRISPETVFCGTSVHVFVSDNGGWTWKQRYCQMISEDLFKTNGLETTYVFNGVFDPHDPKRLYLCYADIQLVVTDDFNNSFYSCCKGMNYKDDVTNVIVDPIDPTKIWACPATLQYGGICRSTNGGKTWNVVGSPDTGLPAGKIRTILVDPTSPAGRRALYVTCLGHGIYKSTDDGLSWNPINNGLPEVGRKAVVDIVMNPDNSENLRCLLGSNPSDGSGIYESEYGGMNWRRITRVDAPFAMVRDLAVDPKQWNTLYVCQFTKWIKRTFTGGLYKSTDGGKTWGHVYSGYDNAECLAISPVNSNVLYLGTCEHPYHDNCRAPGVLKSSNGGKTWDEENDGLSNTQITSISISPHNPSCLFVGTTGNGAFIGEDKTIRKLNKRRKFSRVWKIIGYQPKPVSRPHH